MVQNRHPDPAEQLCLLSPDELRRMRRLVPRPQEGKVMSRKAPRRDVEGRFTQRADATQPKFPGF